MNIASQATGRANLRLLLLLLLLVDGVTDHVKYKLDIRQHCSYTIWRKIPNNSNQY